MVGAKAKRKGRGKGWEKRKERESGRLVFLRTADGICVKADKAAPPQKQRSLNDALPAITVISSFFRKYRFPKFGPYDTP